MSVYGQPVPPVAQPKKKGGCLKAAAIGVGALVAIGIGAAAASHNSTTPTTTGTSNDGVAVTQTTGAAAPAPDPTTQAPKPTIVLKTSGSGIKNTAQFTVGDSWNLHYTYDCSNFGQAGNFAVNDETGNVMVNELKLKGSGDTPQYNGGTHHLEVNSECDWTLTVTNG